MLRELVKVLAIACMFVKLLSLLLFGKLIAAEKTIFYDR